MSMNRKTIEDAKAEAQVFVTACDAALARLDWENSGLGAVGPMPRKPEDHSYGSPQTGALRRRSMDLTRILAELRRYSA